jgi:trigger factor
VTLAGEAPPDSPADDQPEDVPNVPLELGAAINPPGADEHLLGASIGETRSFTSHYPTDYETAELAGATIDFTMTITGIRRRELLPLDDEFAQEVSDTETLEALRERVRSELQQGAEGDADHEVRHQLLQQLASRLRTAPDALVDQEVDRRLEDLVRRLLGQGIDPTQTEIDWQQFREGQRPAALESVKSTLLLDEIARREGLEASEEDLAAEVEKFAERSGRTAAAVRARLEQDGALDRIRAGIRREKTVRWLIDQATLVS